MHSARPAVLQPASPRGYKHPTCIKMLSWSVVLFSWTTYLEKIQDAAIMKLSNTLWPLVVALVLERGVAGAIASCRNLPGDAGWPTLAAWNRFNLTVGGRLVATVPLGSPCHDPTYLAAECASLQSQWLEPQLQYVLGVLVSR